MINRAEDATEYYANDTAYTEGALANVEAYIDGIVEGSAEGKTLVQAFTEGILQVGDYVNYTPEYHSSVTVGTSETGYTDLNGISDGTDQTFTQNLNTTWRVLGLSEDGQHLLLISGSPIKKDGDDPYLVLESAEGAANCVTVLNKVSELYHNSILADETRSITIDDIERVLGGVTVEYPKEGEPETGKVYFTSDVNKTQIGSTTGYPSYIYLEGDYTLTNPPQKVTSTTAGTTIDANAYNFGYDYDGYKSLGINISKRAYDMLFEGAALGDNNNEKSYWLASQGVDSNSINAIFGVGYVSYGSVSMAYYSYLFYTDGRWEARGRAVRPVVVLKSGIQYGEGARQLKKIEDQEEDSWTEYEFDKDYGFGDLDDK